MAKTLSNQIFKRLFPSNRALALPVTFLILFVSTLGIVSITYYFSVERINSQGQVLKVSTAKQNLLSLDDEILSTVGHPGSSSTIDLTDSGGLTDIQPKSSVLNISISDNSAIEETIFNASVGMISYQLPYSSSSETGVYLKGDSQTIANQSGSSMSQLYIENGSEHPEIILRYRPSVTVAVTGLENGKLVNNIRIYVINLNSSVALSLHGKLPLKISCISTELISRDYEISNEPEELTITSFIDNAHRNVSIPISSTSEGTVVHIEIIISNVSIQRWIR